MGLAMWALGWVSLRALDRELLNSLSLLSFLLFFIKSLFVINRLPLPVCTSLAVRFCFASHH